MHVTNELLSKIAACLPLRDRCQAVYTSRQWREVFLTTPGLWDHLDFVFTRDNDGCRTWVALMQLLFKRSAGRPLTLDFEIFPTVDPSRAALARVYGLIARHMPHMKSLSLVIPSANDLPMFAVRAPILETLRITTSAVYDSDEQLPNALFNGIAPQLRTLYLHCIELPSAPCSAIIRVENLFLHVENEVTDEHVLRASDCLPSLTTLTLTSGKGFATGGVNLDIPTVVELRLNVQEGMDDLVAQFPNAQNVAYSCSTANNSRGSPDAAQTVLRALRAAGHPLSIEIRWAPLHVNMPEWFSPSKAPQLVIVLDGRKVIVDVVLHAVQAALTVNVMKSLVPRAQKIVVPEELWDVFSRRKLLSELDVTLLLRDWATTLGKVYRQQSVSSLTLVRASGDEDVVLPVAAALLASFVRTSFVPNALRCIVLAGFYLDDASAFANLGVEVRVKSAWGDRPDDELWTWEIGTTALEM